MTHHTLSLYELNNLVREVIETTFDRDYWVEAEVSEVRVVKGHCYMELIQKDIFSSTPIARASAKCWKNTWQYLRPKFEETTGQPLHPGLKVMLSVTPSFHEAYGFSWIVNDIDPTYTMGDMARKRMEIITHLKEQGIFELQKELDISPFAQRIAVISSEQAAGYGDFCDQLINNDYGFVFYPSLFPATMQGEKVEKTVIAALNDIYTQMDLFDAVVIIRGGGATADLSGFDTLSLAENVANFPLPIITGIGHERDESILDMVSHTRVKTPTAAATFLIDQLAITWSTLEQWQNNITRQVQSRLEQELKALQYLSQRIPALFSHVKTRHENKLERLSSSMISLMLNKMTRAQNDVERTSAKLQMAIERKMMREQNRLQQLMLRTQGIDPEILLKRGYSITLHRGKIVRDASALTTGCEIETKLQHGSLRSIVK